MGFNGGDKVVGDLSIIDVFLCCGRYDMSSADGGKLVGCDLITTIGFYYELGLPVLDVHP